MMVRLSPLLHITLCTLLWTVVCSCAIGPPNAIDVSTYPRDMRQRYFLFAHKCSRCHTLERPLQSHVGKGGWGDYVRRMSRHPGAGISESDQRQIAFFLEYHYQREAERPR